MSFFKPERYFSRLSDIDIQRDLLDCGFSRVLLDMDNTVVSRESHDCPSDILCWLKAAQDAGVAVCLLSNNWHTSPFEWSEKLGLPVVAKACKPLPHAFLIARQLMGARSTNAVVIGDQVSTDVVGAHNIGMKVYLVDPLSTVDLKHTLVLRKLEALLLGDMVPEHRS